MREQVRKEIMRTKLVLVISFILALGLFFFSVDYSEVYIVQEDQLEIDEKAAHLRQSEFETLNLKPKNNATNSHNDDSKVHDSCLQPASAAPIPAILMSLGRSGSGSTWQIMGNLTGKETPSTEYTGGSTKKSVKFFESIGPDDEGRWMSNYLCRLQNKFKTAGIIGFKWKPYESIFLEASISGLKFAASSKPPVRIVRLRRNLLDVIISRYKHNHFDSTRSHCMQNDQECIQNHLNVETGLSLPTERLVRGLQSLTELEDKTDQLLVQMNVSHIHVSYEKLYHHRNAEEWARIFEFLGRGPQEGLTWEKVTKAMMHACTSYPFHNMTLSNFEEVQMTLKGTEFEHLLHR